MHQTTEDDRRTSSPYAAEQVSQSPQLPQMPGEGVPEVATLVELLGLIGHESGGASPLPSSVMTALTLLTDPGSRPSGPHGPDTYGVDDFGLGADSLGADGLGADGPDLRDVARVRAAQEIDRIEAADRVTAWAHHLQLGAIARLRDAVGAHCDTQFTSEALHHGASYDVDREAETATADEVALVTGLPDHEAARRLRLAAPADGRGRVALTRLHEGRTTLDRCLRILDATSDCHPDDVNTITDRVLAELPDGSKPSHRLFMRRLRRQVVLHQPDATTRHADAIARRTAFGELLDDGTGVLTVTGDGPRVVAALDRIDALARTLRAVVTVAPSPRCAPTSPSTSSSSAGPHPPTPLASAAPRPVPPTATPLTPPATQTAAAETTAMAASSAMAASATRDVAK